MTLQAEVETLEAELRTDPTNQDAWIRIANACCRLDQPPKKLRVSRHVEFLIEVLRTAPDAQAISYLLIEPLLTLAKKMDQSPSGRGSSPQKEAFKRIAGAMDAACRRRAFLDLMGMVSVDLLLLLAQRVLSRGEVASLLPGALDRLDHFKLEEFLSFLKANLGEREVLSAVEELHASRSLGLDNVFFAAGRVFTEPDSMLRLKKLARRMPARTGDSKGFAVTFLLERG